MILHSTTKYKNYIILVYQDKNYYKTIICNVNGNREDLIAMYQTAYEALSYAKKRIDTK